MNRLQETFERARAGGRKLLCPFLTAGFPSVEGTAEIMLAVQAGGAGVIELGIPFSDPVADGPVIQASYTEALASGATVVNSLASVKAARGRGLTVPVVAMVSYSIVFKRGTREFAGMCVANEVDGVILPDVPLEEARGIAEAFGAAGLRTCLLVAPTTPAARRAEIAALCDGFVYYLSVSGITGERRALPTDMAANVAGLRSVTKAAVCVGFGISTAEQVRAVTHEAGADGAIVGSAVIRRITETKGGVREKAEAVRGLVGELAKGL